MMNVQNHFINIFRNIGCLFIMNGRRSLSAIIESHQTLWSLGQACNYKIFYFKDFAKKIFAAVTHFPC